MQFIFHTSAHAVKGANKAQDPRGVNGHGTTSLLLVFVSQQNNCYLLITCIFCTAEISCRIELHLLDPSILTHRLQNTRRLSQNKTKHTYGCLCQPTHSNKLPTSNHVHVNFHINLYL
jgi:hypothetical protein